MGFTRPAKPTRAGPTGTGWGFRPRGIAGSKYRKVLLQAFGLAVRAGRPFPLYRAHQHFAVSSAIVAMKFIDRHGNSLTDYLPNSIPEAAMSRGQGLKGVNREIGLVELRCGTLN